MKKIITLLLIFVMCSGCAFALDVLPLMSSKSEQQDRVWVGTFQLVWNDFSDGIVKGPVQFRGGKSKLAEELNKRDFTADRLSESSYYKTYGAISPDLKAQIETAIKEKFNETSDILGMIDWTPATGKYLVYAMLKKDFKFLVPFDKLKQEKFGKNREKIQYFGINNKSKGNLRDQISVLFYNSADDFALKIRTEGRDELYLYRTRKDETFDKLYTAMTAEEYDGFKGFAPKDELKVPDINLYALKSFDELCGRKIKHTKGLIINTALETVDFKMNNEGVKLKSEAAIATAKSILIPQELKPRKFYFDDTFVLFLKEQGRDKPYFALRVHDAALVNKTGKSEK
ncbi:MAG: hypothetical protein LBK53_08490 [Heliobacteriaceae bacterium]|jgi:hypothetical protein|nr:hypothetical protein [Heliobacteriaceae bacterium]